MPTRLYRRQGTVLPGGCRADQPRAFGAERRLAREGHLAAHEARATGAFSTSISAWTSGPASTTCLTSTPGSARSSGFSATPRDTDVALAAYLDLTGAADTAGRAGERARLPGGELRPDQRARSPAQRRPDAAGLAGLAAHGRRDRLVRAR